MRGPSPRPAGRSPAPAAGRGGGLAAPKAAAGTRAPSPRPAGGSSPVSPKEDKGRDQRKLLEEYTVGATLGEGAFGVVRVCHHRATGKEYAVKMVDKVETPVPAIMREAEMLQSMNHPNIVKFHDVFIERCFVCIVMEIYRGGDLVDGLQRSGPFDSEKILHVFHQMAASIHHLHDKMVGHRDVKGDNYMMDRQDILDPGCVIVLTDFGTAAVYKPAEPFTAQVGTRQFWAPELLDKSYGLKVDIWAMGVLSYGLVTGRFPFKDETDIRKKEIKIRTACHPECVKFILGMLDKTEAKRFDSKEVMAHPWLKAAEATAAEEVEEAPPTEERIPQMIKEDGANVGIRDRRDELVERLHKEQEKKEGRPTSRRVITVDAPFTIESKLHPGMKLGYEWWDQAKIASSGLLDVTAKAEPAADDNLHNSTDLSVFSKMLQEHGIDSSMFGTGKTKSLATLAGEVRSGEARLMLDATAHKKLVRAVDIVVLRLYSSEDRSQYLVETQVQKPSRDKYDTMRLPAKIKAPHENPRMCLERLLRTINMSPEMVTFDLEHSLKAEEESESVSYPGVQTYYNKELFEGVVNVSAMTPEQLELIGLPGSTVWSSEDARDGVKFHEWMTDEQAQAHSVQFKAKAEGEDVSALVHAPIGMNEQDLHQKLHTSGVDVSKFGQGNSKTLKDFSQELFRGEASLTDGASGELLRIVNVVIIILTEIKSGCCLVQTHQIAPNGSKKETPRLPGGKCRPDENHFICANRVIQRELEIDQNLVSFSETVRFVEEEQESPSYPGIKTVYRKFLVTGSVSSP